MCSTQIHRHWLKGPLEPEADSSSVIRRASMPLAFGYRHHLDTKIIQSVHVQAFLSVQRSNPGLDLYFIDSSAYMPSYRQDIAVLQWLRASGD